MSIRLVPYVDRAHSCASKSTPQSSDGKDITQHQKSGIMDVHMKLNGGLLRLCILAIVEVYAGRC